MKHLYGYRCKECGLFIAVYKTIQGTRKTACFRTKRNAEDLLKWQGYRDRATVEIMATVEERPHD